MKFTESLRKPWTKKETEEKLRTQHLGQVIRIPNNTIPTLKEETEETAINHQLVKSTILPCIIWETNGSATGCTPPPALPHH